MRRIIFPVCIGFVALTACSPETSGVASPANTPSSPSVSNTSPEVPGPGVPKVGSPIDTDQFASAPCTAMTESQVTELFGRSVTPKPDLQGPAGPTCTWDPADGSGASVNLIFSKVDRLGLTSVYQAKGSTYKFFEVLEPVGDYPAVAYGTADHRADGVCSIAVGTSDHNTLDIAVTQSREKIGNSDPCAVAQTVGSKVLATVKGGN
ncbi:DUF3558 domain-containing protein [Amycolatopsis sp., V23-08]|uniref:DUF3558 domain-containing protein n=1 Tax=Amycolatopsis heterodermiae TaxID=3110235 RepID=A0ABU5R6R4_9PSEU|nr:DUF3558 domain-containing protein [Amycolatopsis sp., V23-08]MEA5361918.1 DUF3558 domain-containing protein [Amycolatopsis sp., V23-08]